MTQSSDKDPIKIKGFFIGMSIDEAHDNLLRLGFENPEIRESGSDDPYYIISNTQGAGWEIRTSSGSRKVHIIAFSGPRCDDLFNTHNINVDIFKEAFTKAYGLCEKTEYRYPFSPGSTHFEGWEYFDPQLGHRIRLGVDKSLSMIKSSVFAEFEFD